MNTTVAVVVLLFVVVLLVVVLLFERRRPRVTLPPLLVDDYREFVIRSCLKNSNVVEAEQAVFAVEGDLGKVLFLPRARTGSGELVTRITAVLDSYRVEVAHVAERNCGTGKGETAAQARAYFGTDNSAVLQMLFDEGAEVRLPRTKNGYLVEAPMFAGPICRLRGDGLSLIRAGAGLTNAGMPETRANTTVAQYVELDAVSCVVTDTTLFPEKIEFSIWFGITDKGKFIPSEQIRVRRIHQSTTDLAILGRNVSGTCEVTTHPVGEEVRLSAPAAVIYANQLPPEAGNYQSGVWHHDNSDGYEGTAAAGSDSNVHLRAIVSDVMVAGLDVGQNKAKHVVEVVFSERASTWFDNVKAENVWHAFDFEDYVDQSGMYRTVFTSRRDYVFDWRNPGAADIGSYYWQHSPGDCHVMIQPKGGMCPGQRIGTYSNCHGGTIISPVGGGFHMTRCVGMSITGGHFEADQTSDNWAAVTCRASDLTIADTYWHDSEQNADAPDQGMVLVDDDIGPSYLRIYSCASLHYIGNNLGGENLPQERGWDLKIRRPHRDTRITVRDFRPHVNSRQYGKGRGGYETDHVIIAVDTETGTDDQVALALALEQALADASATIQGGSFDVRYWSGMWLVSSSLQGVEYRPVMITPRLSDITYSTDVMGRLTNGHRYRYRVAALDDSGYITAASEEITSPQIKCGQNEGAQIAFRVQTDHSPVRLRVWRQNGTDISGPFTPSVWLDLPRASADSYVFDEGDRINGVKYLNVDLPAIPEEATTENHQVVKNRDPFEVNPL